MPFLCYKCNKVIYHGSPEFHNIFCRRKFRNNYRNNYNNNYYNNRIDNNVRNRNNGRNYHINNNWNSSRRNNYNNNYRNQNNNYNYRNNYRTNRINRNYFYRNNNHNDNNTNDSNELRHSLNRILDLLNNNVLSFNINNLLNTGNNNEINNDDNNSHLSQNINDSNSWIHPALSEDEDNSSDLNDGLDEDLINSFPKTKIEDIGKLKEKKCIICLDEFKNGDENTTVPCFHIFHPHCINKWLEKHNICPICKTEFNKVKNNF